MTQPPDQRWGEQLLRDDTEYVITHIVQRRSHEQRILIEPREVQQAYAAARTGAVQTVFACLLTLRLTAGTTFADAVNLLSAAVPVQYHRLTHQLFVEPDSVIGWQHE